MSREQRAFMFGDQLTTQIDSPAKTLYDTRKELLANQIRSLYCVCVREMTGDASYGTRPMPAWDGDPQGLTGRRTQNCWLKIAKLVMRLQADPIQFVRSQFYATKLAKPPAPNTFTGDAAVAKYELFKQQARSDLVTKTESDLNQIRIHLLPFVVTLGWDYAKALDYTLRDNQCGASPLVRYCFAVEANLPVAACFRERALAQYMFQMADYDAVLQSRIPQELRVEASQLTASFVGCDRKDVSRDVSQPAD